MKRKSRKGAALGIVLLFVGVMMFILPSAVGFTQAMNRTEVLFISQIEDNHHYALESAIQVAIREVEQRLNNPAFTSPIQLSSLNANPQFSEWPAAAELITQHIQFELRNRLGILIDTSQASSRGIYNDFDVNIDIDTSGPLNLGLVSSSNHNHQTPGNFTVTSSFYISINSIIGDINERRMNASIPHPITIEFNIGVENIVATIPGNNPYYFLSLFPPNQTAGPAQAAIAIGRYTTESNANGNLILNGISGPNSSSRTDSHLNWNITGGFQNHLLYYIGSQYGPLEISYDNINSRFRAVEGHILQSSVSDMMSWLFHSRPNAFPNIPGAASFINTNHGISAWGDNIFFAGPNSLTNAFQNNIVVWHSGQGLPGVNTGNHQTAHLEREYFVKPHMNFSASINSRIPGTHINYIDVRGNLRFDRANITIPAHINAIRVRGQLIIADGASVNSLNPNGTIFIVDGHYARSGHQAPANNGVSSTLNMRAFSGVSTIHSHPQNSGINRLNIGIYFDSSDQGVRGQYGIRGVGTNQSARYRALRGNVAVDINIGGAAAGGTNNREVNLNNITIIANGNIFIRTMGDGGQELREAESVNYWHNTNNMNPRRLNGNAVFIANGDIDFVHVSHNLERDSNIHLQPNGAAGSLFHIGNPDVFPQFYANNNILFHFRDMNVGLNHNESTNIGFHTSINSITNRSVHVHPNNSSIFGVFASNGNSSFFDSRVYEGHNTAWNSALVRNVNQSPFEHNSLRRQIAGRQFYFGGLAIGNFLSTVPGTAIPQYVAIRDSNIRIDLTNSQHSFFPYFLANRIKSYRDRVPENMRIYFDNIEIETAGNGPTTSKLMRFQDVQLPGPKRNGGNQPPRFNISENAIIREIPNIVGGAIFR